MHSLTLFRILITLYLFQVQDTRIDQTVHDGLDVKMHRKPCKEGYPPGRCNPALKRKIYMYVILNIPSQIAVVHTHATLSISEISINLP